ncbi:MAG: hypothetical protein CL847_06230 [Crocinitomicaceae bacterium]|nr:hypothetical protein [Crocinitomicaceae bacterium]
MKHILTLLLLATMSMSYGIAQSKIPGQEAFESAFGTSVELDLEKCCLAAYGWHNAKEIKFEGVTVVSLKSNNVAKELLKSNITPSAKEQYFTAPDGRIIVVLAMDQFEKVYGRFLINLNATKG